MASLQKLYRRLHEPSNLSPPQTGITGNDMDFPRRQPWLGYNALHGRHLKQRLLLRYTVQGLQDGSSAKVHQSNSVSTSKGRLTISDWRYGKVHCTQPGIQVKERRVVVNPAAPDVLHHLRHGVCCARHAALRSLQLCACYQGTHLRFAALRSLAKVASLCTEPSGG